MAKPSFRLNKYFFPAININANPEHKPKEENDALFDIAVNVTKLPGKPHGYQLLLNVQILEEDSKNPPYTGSVQVVGSFSTDDTLSHEESAVLIHKKGTGILYSAAREFLLLVTGRGPWGPLIIPILDDLSDIQIEEIKADVNNTE